MNVTDPLPAPHAVVNSHASPAFWRKIEAFLKNRTLIPILGPGVITFGNDDQLLYPWLTAQVAERLEVPGTPALMHRLVCGHLQRGGSVEDVCLEMDDLLNNAAPAPGPLMLSLASIAQCRLFFTLGIDSLMEHALDSVRGAGRSVTRTWTFSLDRSAEDLPDPAGVGTLLGYLFGKASPNPGYHLWDADAIEFVWQLQRQLPALNHLGRTLAENNLLVIGTNLSDWMVRFFMRAVRQRPLTEGAGKNLFLADAAPQGQPDAVVFYDSLKRGIEIVPVDPVAFAREFCSRAAALQAPLTSGIMPGTTLALPFMEPKPPDGAIFISYSHVPADAAAAFRIVEKLRAKGCLVWLDEERLMCGDDFENHLEDAVRHCSFFLSVISSTTEGRRESYFHKERDWAEKRDASVAHSQRYYFPVIVDDTPVPLRQEPRRFVTVDAERAPAGEISDDLCKRLKALQDHLLGKSA